MKRVLITVLAGATALLTPATVCAAPGSAASTDAVPDLRPMVLIGLAAMLILAKLGGELFERIKQPAVLGELIAGIIIGNLMLFGFTAAEPLKTDGVIAALSGLDLRGRRVGVSPKRHH